MLGDFVERSYIKGTCVGVVGVKGTSTLYVKLDTRRDTLTLKLADENLAPVLENTRVTLHFKSL